MRPAVLALLLLAGCGGAAPEVSPPSIREQSSFDTLSSLPAPVTDPLIVAVYRFDDQTGQRAVLNRPVAEMSTALPQGLAAILVQELHRAGAGKYYRVVERETIDSLLNERRIATTMLGPERAQTALQPLLLPGVILTGGAVYYDRKVYQNFRGLGFDSANATSEVYADQVGVILRAISVQTGEVVQSVHARKEVLSRMNRLTGLEILDESVLALELGQVTNEPVSLAVRLAIAAAVVELTRQGAEDGWWELSPDTADSTAASGPGQGS